VERFGVRAFNCREDFMRSSPIFWLNLLAVGFRRRRNHEGRGNRPWRSPFARRPRIEALERRELLAILGIESAQASESAAQIVFQVTADVNPASDVTVAVLTSPGTANRSGETDYTPAVNFVTFQPAGPLTKSVTVTLANDTHIEANETFFIKLAAPSAGWSIDSAKAEAVGTIIDDDAIMVVGPDFDNGSNLENRKVEVWSPNGSAPMYDFFPYGASFGGGVRVAGGHINGDGVPDIITAAGTGGGPHVKVFDGATSSQDNPVEIRSFFAYAATWSGGVFVATGDVNGDGQADIVTAAGPGGGPHVKVFDGHDLHLIREFYAFEQSYSGGVRVAVGDVNDDGSADIIAGEGVSATDSRLRVFSGTTNQQLHQITPYPGFNGGIYVAAGDVDGDGRVDVITGAGPGGTPHVKVYKGQDLDQTPEQLLGNFLAYAESVGTGVRVGAGDVNGNGAAEVITGTGPGGGPHVKAVTASGTKVKEFYYNGNGSFTGGVFVDAETSQNARGHIRIIDNNEPGFSATSPPFFHSTNGGLWGDSHYSPAGAGNSVATWTFNDLAPGRYRVSTTWTVHSTRPSNAPYKVFSGSNELVAEAVNQEMAPDDFKDLGIWWDDLGATGQLYEITGTSLTVQVTDGGNEWVSADAVRVELVTPLNNEPVIDHIGLRSARAGQAFAFSVNTAADPDSKLFRLVENEATGSTINLTTGGFTWTVPSGQAPGDYKVTVEVIDSGTPIGVSQQSFTIRVLRPAGHPLGEEAYFADPDVDRAVRNALLARPEEESLLKSQLTALTTLRLDSNLVDSLEGLQHATSLTSLYLIPGDPTKPGLLTSGTPLAPLANLTSLQTLALGGVDMPTTSLASLTSLTNLQSLDLRYNELTDIATTGTLPELPNLKSLDLRYNRLNLSDANELPRAKLDTLTHLYLHGNDDPAFTNPEVPNLNGIRGLLVNIDLAPVGLDKATTVADLAKALHYLPIDIFEYVVNNFEHQAYDGLMKGPQATLDTKAGNAWDLGALFIELLNAAYAGTTHTLSPKIVSQRIRLQDNQTAMDWVGMRDINAAGMLLNDAGLHVTVVQVQPSLELLQPLQFDHAFVEATFPTPSGNQVIRLDPSWKFKDYRSGIADFLEQNNATAILELVPFDQAAKDDYLSEVRDELTYEWYEEKVQEYLNEHLPGTSAADLGYDGPIKRQSFESLPGLPSGYMLVGAPLATYSYGSIDLTEHHRMVVTLTSGQTSVATSPIKVTDAALSTLVLRYVPDGSNLRGQFFLAGDQKFPGTGLGGIAPNSDVSLKVDLFKPGESSSYSTTTYPRKAGQVLAIGLEANQISDRMLFDLQSQINTAALEAISQSQPGLFGADDVGKVLSYAMAAYFRRTDHAQQVLDRFAHTIQARNYIAVGTATGSGIVTSNNFEDHDSLQIPVIPDDLVIDIPGNFVSARSIDAKDGRTEVGGMRFDLAAYNMSAQEHAIWEELTNTTAMSTIKSLQDAREDATNQVVTFYATEWFGPGNWREDLDVHHPASSLNAIDAAINNGADHFIVPLRPTELDGWSGVGFIAQHFNALNELEPLGYIIASSDGSPAHGGDPTPNGFQPPAPPAAAPNQFAAGDPVNVANGAVIDDVVDISIPRVGLPLVFERHYDSSTHHNDGHADTLGHLGRNWFHTYGQYLTFEAGDDIVWTNDRGQKFKFDGDGAGNYTVPRTLRGEFKRTGTAPSYEYLFRNKDGIAYKFNSAGQLAQILDHNGNALHVIYATGNQISEVRHFAAGATTYSSLVFTYGVVGVRTRIMSVAFADRKWMFTYHTDGGLAQVTSPSNATTPAASVKYRYWTEAAYANTQVFGKLKDIEGPDGGVTRHTYYPNGRGFEVLSGFAAADPESAAHRQTFHYDLYRQRTTFFNERGEPTLYGYNDDGNLIELVHADGSSESFKWQNGLQKEHTDAAGITQFFVHGTAGSEDEKFGNVTQTYRKRVYPGTSPQPVLLDAQGVEVPTDVDMTYATKRDGANNLVRSVLATSTDPLGVVTQYFYDNAGYPGNFNPGNATRIVRAAGQSEETVTTMTYNAQGQVLTLTSPRGTATTTIADDHLTTFTYDATTGQVDKTTTWVSGSGATAVKAETNNDYNALGHLIRTVDARGNATLYANDFLGRRTQTILPEAYLGQPLAERTWKQTYYVNGLSKTSNRPAGPSHHHRVRSAAIACADRAAGRRGPDCGL
jgi:YD repeat-containing protein